jgi:hypothetical protein
VYKAIKNYSKQQNRTAAEIVIIDPDKETLQSMLLTVEDLIATERSLADQSSASSHAHAALPTEDCVICTEPLIHPKILVCGHKFCTKCMDKWLGHNPVCPTCKQIQGVRIGDQPEGRMAFSYYSYTSLPGFERCGSYYIAYYFSAGIQGVCV